MSADIFCKSYSKFKTNSNCLKYILMNEIVFYLFLYPGNATGVNFVTLFKSYVTLSPFAEITFIYSKSYLKTTHENYS